MQQPAIGHDGAKRAVTLREIRNSTNESVQAARQQARKTILDTLQIHPVSAPELRKLLLEDEDDGAFLSDIEQTGVPQLQASLSALAQQERESRKERIRVVYERLSRILINELSIINGQWRERDRAADEAASLESHPKKATLIPNT